jgi:hypothetical protein
MNATEERDQWVGVHGLTLRQSPPGYYTLADAGCP